MAASYTWIYRIGLFTDTQFLDSWVWKSLRIYSNWFEIDRTRVSTRHDDGCTDDFPGIHGFIGHKRRFFFMAQYPKHELVGYPRCLDLNITLFDTFFAYPNFRPVKLGDWWQDESGHWHFGGATAVIHCCWLLGSGQHSAKTMGFCIELHWTYIIEHSTYL